MQPLSRPPPADDRAQLEVELIQSLKEMLGRTFRPNKLATILERKLGEVSKRFARIFFESELHDKIRGAGDEAKAMRFADQSLYHAFVRTQDDVMAQLDSYQYVNEAVKERAKEHYYGIIKDLRNAFLARTTPELNTLVKYLNEVLSQFFTVEMPPMLGELAWEVVKEAKLADARTGAGYKISATAFPMFRSAFERRFLQRLVPVRGGRDAEPRARHQGSIPRRDTALRRRPGDLQRRMRGRLRGRLRHALQRRLPRPPERLARAPLRGRLMRHEGRRRDR